MPHLIPKATMFLIVLMDSFSFRNVSLQNFDRTIPPQNVLNNEEIKWNKTRNLNGFYKIVLLIYCKSPPQDGKVLLIIGEGDTMKNFSASHLTGRDDKDFMFFRIILPQIKINDGQEIKLLYEGSRNLEIKEKPRSQITLTKISQINQTPAHETNVYITIRPNNEDKAGVASSGNINNLSIWLIFSILPVVMFYLLHM